VYTFILVEKRCLGLYSFTVYSTSFATGER